MYGGGKGKFDPNTKADVALRLFAASRFLGLRVQIPSLARISVFL
jgi:hypothetical protein